MNGETSLWQSKSFIKAATAAVFLLAILILVSIFSEFKEYRFIGGGVPVANTISVSGEGEVFAVPDVAKFTFAVVDEKETAQEAQDISAGKVNAILAYLDEQGVEEKDIRTTSYNVFPQYDYIRGICNEFSCPPGRQEFRGFEVRQTVEVTVRDTDDAGTILAGIGELGADNISGLNFTIEDEEELKSEAREEAIENAREKAEELADQLDVDLVRVVSFSESGGGYYARDFGYGGDFAIAETAAVKAPELPVGENKISSFVQITYEIR